MNDSPRRRARELVLQALYASEHGDATAIDAFDDLIEGEDLGRKNTDFARTLIRLVSERLEHADGHISRLAENWKIERIAAIDRDILRMAIIELESVPDTPVKVVINEAIELAKKYSTVESSKFVNGILDNFLSELEQK